MASQSSQVTVPGVFRRLVAWMKAFRRNSLLSPVIRCTDCMKSRFDRVVSEMGLRQSSRRPNPRSSLSSSRSGRSSGWAPAPTAGRAPLRRGPGGSSRRTTPSTTHLTGTGLLHPGGRGPLPHGRTGDHKRAEASERHLGNGNMPPQASGGRSRVEERWLKGTALAR